MDTGEDDATVIQYWANHGLEFPGVSGTEGGANAVNSAYGIGAYPTYILIAPDHSIVEQDMWPIASTQTFIDHFESNGLVQSECGAMTASFTSDETTVCSNNTVAFTDLSSGSITSWSWTFEGGDPATSSEQNPSVVYANTGDFDVSLEVSDGTNTNLASIDDYMTVLLSPPAMLQPFDEVCDDDPAFELTGGSPNGGVYSGPGVTNNWFDPAIAGLGTHTITYTYTAANGCENNAEETIEVDICSGISPQTNNTFSIYPNPSSGKIQIEFEATGKSDIKVVNLLGVVVFQTSISTSGQVEQTVDLSNLESGLYFVSIKTTEKTFVQKLKLNAR